MAEAGQLIGTLACEHVLREPWLNASQLLKFDVKERGFDVISTLRLNNAPVLPLGAMPLYINAYQTVSNITQDTMDKLVSERLLDPDFAWQTKYHEFPLQYEHVLLRTKTPGQWWMQLDILGLQYGEDGEPLRFPDENHKLVQVLVKQVRTKLDYEVEEHEELSIEDIQIVERSQRAQPTRMKCGKLAMVKTTFDPNEWDEYGKLGSWTRVWNMVFGKIGQFWEDYLQHNALLLPLYLVLAFVIFFARVYYKKRQQSKTMDAEYALLEAADEDLPPAYADIPIIKIEAYD